MGVLEKKVQVKGDVKAIWETLLQILEINKYQIEKQLPYSQVRAKAGSKAISILLGGTKDGFRDVVVEILPQGQAAYEVSFRFGLPSWTLNYPGIKKDCARLPDDLVRRMEHGWEAAPAPQTGGGLSCGKCGSLNPPDAAFCSGCGAKIQPPQQTREAAGSLICASCGAPNPPGAVFCGQCGSKMEPAAPAEKAAPEHTMCSKCKIVLPEGAKFCLQCGTRVGE